MYRPRLAHDSRSRLPLLWSCRRKNALHLLLLTLAALAVVSFQWFFWGYSLAFSQTSGAFLGNLRNFGYMGVLENPVPQAYNKVPEIVYAIYQCMFANLVPAIAIGAACERGRVWPFLIFTFVWTTLVYDVIACWVWNPTGWASSGVCSTTPAVDLSRSTRVSPVSSSRTTSALVTATAPSVCSSSRTTSRTSSSAPSSSGSAGLVSTAVPCLPPTFAQLWPSAPQPRRFGSRFDVDVPRLASGAQVVRRRFLHRCHCGLVAITPAAGFVGMPAALLIGVVSAAFRTLPPSSRVPCALTM